MGEVWGFLLPAASLDDNKGVALHLSLKPCQDLSWPQGYTEHSDGFGIWCMSRTMCVRSFDPMKSG